MARDTRRHHTLEYRVSFPTLFWGSYYLAVFAGPERRNPLRLAAEGQTALGRQARFVGCVLLLSLSLAFFGLFCALYLFKSAVGIELFSGQSPFHPLFELFLTSWNASVAKLQS